MKRLQPSQQLSSQSPARHKVRRGSFRLLLLTLLVALPAAEVGARLTRTVIESVSPLPVKTGKIPYERVSGTFYGELSPRDSHNRIVTDLSNAPRNVRGLVEYSATFALARPIGADKGSGVLFYDVPNRGNANVAADPDGHIRLISGWQGDIAPAKGIQTASVPVAVGLTGAVMARFESIAESAKSAPIVAGFGRTGPRPIPVSLDTRKASVTMERAGSSPRVIAASDFAFADCRDTPFPGKPDPTQLCLKAGFDPDAAYTLRYTGKDPLVLGIGFAATRDLISYMRSGKADDAGTSNPAGSSIRWAVAAGNSQSGNFLRSFVHLGFNLGEQGGRVFDGIHANIAARHVPLNVRFGVPGGAAGKYELGSEGPLWWAPHNDRVRGRGTGSLLTRCTASDSCPKVIETLGSAEFWNLRASPGFVGLEATSDIALPSNVRRYYFPSVSHGGSWGGTPFPVNGTANPPGCALRGNPIPIGETVSVAQRLLVEWVKDGTLPPPSRYPTLARGDLVESTAKAGGWPSIPGAPTPDGKINPFYHYDAGAAFNYNDVSGVADRQPPRIKRILPMLVPRVNADGNETSGIVSVELQVPLGTYTGWNVLAKGYGAGGGCSLFGGFIPFAKTKAEREATGDPRLSLVERYTDHAGFVAKVREAVTRQQVDGWLLADDAARIIVNAESSDVLKGD